MVVGVSHLTRHMSFPARGSVPALRCTRRLINLKPARPRVAADEIYLGATHVKKLTWLALAEDHAALSRSLEQLMALPRSVKVKRVLLVSLAAKFLREAASARAAVDQSNMWREAR